MLPEDSCVIRDDMPGSYGVLILQDFGRMVRFWPGNLPDIDAGTYWSQRGHFCYFRRDFRERSRRVDTAD